MSQDLKATLSSLLRNVGWLPITYQIITNSIPWNLKSPTTWSLLTLWFSLLLPPNTGPLFLPKSESAQFLKHFPCVRRLHTLCPMFPFFESFLTLHIKILTFFEAPFKSLLSYQTCHLKDTVSPFEWYRTQQPLASCLLLFSFSFDSKLLVGRTHISFIFLSHGTKPVPLRTGDEKCLE